MIDPGSLSGDELVTLFQQSADALEQVPGSEWVPVAVEGGDVTCARCGQSVTDGSLYAVDMSIRHSTAVFDVDERTVRFDTGRTDYGSTLYFLHDVGSPHPVGLPEGWRQDWVG